MNLNGDIICDNCDNYLGRIESNVVFVCDRVVILCNNCGCVFEVITGIGFEHLMNSTDALSLNGEI